MLGPTPIVALVDGWAGPPDELRRDDNSTTATLMVAGKPDLTVSGNDISITPAHPQPGRPSTLTFAIHNIGESDAANAGWAVYDVVGSNQTLAAKGTIPAIAATGSQSATASVTLSAGSHVLRVVADPDGLIGESNEQNNSASSTVVVAPAASVDLRIRPGAVTGTPQHPAAGTGIQIGVVVDNTGSDPVDSTVAIYDGVPGAGATLIASLPISLDRQSSTSLSASDTVTASSRVIYAVADPDNLVPEIDESNNQAYALLTDQFSDFTIAGHGRGLPRTPLAAGQTITARAVVRNVGSIGVTHAEVVVYDDLPQSGGAIVADQFVDVPAQGKAVATWTIRAGQHFATAVVNPTHAIAEIDLSNNRATRLYTADGTGPDIVLDPSLPRQTAIDRSAITIDPSTLAVGGSVRLSISAPVSVPFTITVFDDVDGDLAYNPEFDTTLGLTLVQPGLSQQTVTIPLQGSVRYVPGHLVAYLDSGNAVAEIHEDNNFVDLSATVCAGTLTAGFNPQMKWSSPLPANSLTPSARLADTNGDDVVDDNDTPAIIVPAGGGISAVNGATGATLWTAAGLDASGRQMSPLIVDVDGDGVPEVIAHVSDGQSHAVACFNHDGSRRWTSPALARDPAWDLFAGLAGFSYAGMPIAADLDGSGKPVIIVGRNVLDAATRAIKWIGTGGSGRQWYTRDDHLYNEHFPDQEAPIAVDLDGDGRLEVVAGNTAYRADGSGGVVHLCQTFSCKSLHTQCLRDKPQCFSDRFQRFCQRFQQRFQRLFR